MTVTLTEREMHVVLNALNYAKNEWASCNDVALTALADDADALETRLQEESAE